MKEESDMAAHRDIRGCVFVVILAFNEAGNLPHLYGRLCSVLEADGWELSLSRNFGHQAALLAAGLYGYLSGYYPNWLIPGWASLATVMTFLGALQLIGTGILGE